MEKRTGVTKNTNGNGNKNGNGKSFLIATSSSSTSMQISQGSNHTTESKIEDGNAEKKMKRDDSSNPPGQGQGSEVKQASMDNLPPEMLTNILKCVDTQNLYKCRLVNKNWSSISSGILTKRSNAALRFELDSNSEFVWRPFTEEKRSLKDFVNSMKKTQNNPYSHFTLFITENSSQSEVFDTNDFKEFLLDFASTNQRIKSLTYVFGFVESMDKFLFFTAKLGDLLLYKIPYLAKLDIVCPWAIKVPELKLFPTQEQKSPESDTTTDVDQTQVAVPAEFQYKLPNLKVIRFDSSAISSCTEIVKNLFNAAVNLSWFSVWVRSLEDFHFLHSLGKIHLLREAKVDVYKTLFSPIQNDKNPLPLPKLENLDLSMSLNKCDTELFTPTTNFLGNLFESSKDTLQVLAVQPFGYLSNLQLPTFKNLRKLSISQNHIIHGLYKQRIFPPGVRSKDIFPAVSDLNLNVKYWVDAFPTRNSIPLLPNLKILNLKNRDYYFQQIQILASMCPNLKKFQIQKYEDGDDYNEMEDENYGDEADGDEDDEFDDYKNKTPPKLNFPLVGHSIWSRMKQLESLEVHIDVDAPEHTSAALDSCFTGISEENCDRLYKMTKTGKKYQKPKFQAKLEERTVREYSSILNMTDLKRLIIHPYLGGKLMDNENEFFTKKLTWISHEYAFKLMPHLKLNDD